MSFDCRTQKRQIIDIRIAGNKGGDCKRDYINETKIDKAIAEVLKLIIIPTEVRQRIANELKVLHDKKNGYSKEVKANLQKQITTWRIELNMRLNSNWTEL